MEASCKHIQILSTRYPHRLFKQYILNAEDVLKLCQFLKNEFRDLTNLKIESSTCQISIVFHSKSTSISDVWTALHLYLKIPYLDSARFLYVKNEIDLANNQT
ncbi:hypothetical protein [Psychroflexus planctonicus]|uniref:hypothetical protein n=1 Tax=Psychroflexus planctonicus TaxID=1526575 RepID=UPI00166C71F0|nr:hypothetical protein [Psychroflexus planctonicus]